ncbi:MAG: glucosyl-3-phosphoglycerate synthase [Actinomycetota bacterium]|nr:glucosyl-3-phosphoglycerate synthase [Actinomycetota bacterium]
MRPDVRKWFDNRTSLSQDWSRQRLAALKGNTRVSVVLPARDEAVTVGDIVATIRGELVHKVPLVDEILVIDSGSVDATAAVARRAGARVVRQADVLPGLGDRPGKGEALWKSLLLTSGDLVVFVDADLREFDEQFVVGLLGPLLTDPSVAFVKAFYDRPLANGDQVLPAGGGRVTELVARPLLNLHWPDAAGFVQPLAGEYAGRRALLERLPFVSGYGVEIGMLIDVLEESGLDTMAQVDLGQRRHRNSSDAALGRMAAQVHLAVLSRLHRHGRALVTDEPAMSMTQFERQGAEFATTTSYVGVTERPPMIELEEYRLRMAAERA